MRSQTTKHLAVPGPDFAHLLQSFFQTSNWVRGLTRWAFANASVRSNCYSNSFRLNRPAQRAALPRRPKFSPSHAKNETETRRNWERGKRIDEMQFVAFFSSHPLIQTRFIFNRRLFEDGKKIVPSFPFFLSFFLSHLFPISCFSLRPKYFYLVPRISNESLPLPPSPVVYKIPSLIR